jgi:GT2 family glycosyltransferase
MLLLDQDTTFSEQFLARMVQYADNLNPDADVAAVVPFLKDGDRAFSPTEIRFGGSRAIHPPAAGKYKARAYAANSGTLMRVSALSDIGGYDERFWLDYSDIVVFHKLYDLGRCIYVAGDLQVQHNLAARNYDRSMSPERYRNFISAEGAYWDLFRGSVESIIHMFRLLARTVKQYFRYSEKSYAKDTWRAFCCRLITSRQQRLREWPNRTASRDLPRLAGPDRAGSGLPL